MDIPVQGSEPLERLFEWIRAEVKKTTHGTVSLEVEIQDGKILNAYKGSKKSERFPLKARK